MDHYHRIFIPIIVVEEHISALFNHSWFVKHPWVPQLLLVTRYLWGVHVLCYLERCADIFITRNSNIIRLFVAIDWYCYSLPQELSWPIFMGWYEWSLACHCWLWFCKCASGHFFLYTVTKAHLQGVGWWQWVNSAIKG